MPKYYLTTTRTCPVDFVHAIEAPDATEAERLMEDEGEGTYLGCSVGESLDLCDDETEISAERPSIVYPDKPALPYLLALIRDALPWLEAAEDLSDDPDNLGELRALQGRGRALLADADDLPHVDRPVAAPTLLQACEQAEYWLTAERERPGQAEPDMILQVLRAAIAKAGCGEDA
jgi:hypothetical protein